MDFESPDVEKDFPGLYASESGKKSNDSDFSDENHERLSKKDLLIGKRKDKKESKKDRGYATLEGESSPEEDTDIKSPSKIKKLKPFKFPSAKKEKREKSREKDVKEKDLEKEKKKDCEKDKDKKKDGEKDKEKKKEGKMKLKLKERKKSKHGDEDNDNIGEERPIFGVPLVLAVEWSRCHDGVDIPLIVRNCIDHIQQAGLKVDGLYKTSGIKSKVQQLRRLYNQREPVTLADYELSVATSLLKQFLRELPEPILTTELLHRFEEAGAVKEVAARGAELKGLVEKLPQCNWLLLAWLIKHFDSVTEHEKLNRMNAQTLSMTLSPVMQMSQRLLSALLCHCSSIFPDTVLMNYVEPVHPASLSLPVTTEGLIEELGKQESFLGQIHSEMNAGFVTKRREEQLWEVQRFITQLKRKLRSLEKASSSQPSLEEVEGSPCSKPCEDEMNSAVQPARQPEIEPVLHQVIPSSTAATLPIPSEPSETVSLSPPPPPSTPPSARSPLSGPQAIPPAPVVLPTIPPTINVPKQSATKVGINEQVLEKDSSVTSLSMEMLPTTSVFGPSMSEEGRDKLNPLTEEELAVRLEIDEWVNLARLLQSMIEKEKSAIADLRLQIYLLGGDPVVYRHRDSRGALAAVDREEETSLLVLGRASDDAPRLRKAVLTLQEGNVLQLEKINLVKSIARERRACVDLRVKIKLQQMKKNKS